MKDYFKTLGVEPDAEPETIRAAYIKLAKEWHPDVTHHDKEVARAHFRELNEAYHELSEGESRARHETAIAHARYIEVLRKIRKWKASSRYRQRKARSRGTIGIRSFGIRK
ncbi:MAG: DnaJ domain-containing protein [Bacteroidota bacterium]